MKKIKMKRINSGELSVLYFEDGEKIRRMILDASQYKTRKEIVSYVKESWGIEIDENKLSLKSFRLLEEDIKESDDISIY